MDPSKKTYDVYVAQIPGDCNEKDISQLFSKCGIVEGIHFLASKPGYTNKVAFVRYLTEAECIVAASSLNNYDLGCNKLRVRYSRKGSQDNGSLNNFENRNGINGNTVGGGFPTSQVSPFECKSFSQPISNGRAATASEWNESSSPVNTKKLIVTSVETALSFWAQDNETNAIRTVTKITEELQATQNIPCTQADIENSSNKVFGSIFDQDGLWYRCDIIREIKVPYGKAAVRYIDYGNVEVVDRSSLVCLPRNLSAIPPQAKEYKLGNLKIAGPNQDSKSKNGLESLTLLINEQLIEARILKSGYPSSVEVFFEGENIGEHQLKKGFLEREEEVKEVPFVNMKRPAQPRIVSNDNASNSTTTVAEITKLKEEIASLRSKLNANDNQFKQLQSKTLIDHRSEMTILQSKLAGKDNEIKKLNSDNVNKTNLVEAIKLNCVGKAFNNLLTKEIKSVREMRDNPSLSPTIPEYITSCLSLVQDKEESLKLERFPKYQEVCSLQNKLAEIQDSIRSCTSKDDIESLVRQRDQSRKAFVERAQMFLKEAESLPFEERKAALQKAIFELEAKHLNDLKSGGSSGENIQDALNGWTQWKHDVLEKLANCRSKVDNSTSALFASLEVIKQQLDLNNTEMVANGDEVLGLDEYLRSISSDVQQEKQNIKENKATEEGSLHLVKVVSTLYQEMLSEIDDIQRFKKDVVPQLLNDQSCVSKWLEEKPQMSTIFQIKKQIKDQRSKFRHCHADKNDLEEEGEDVDPKDLEKVNNKLRTILNEMHSLLVKEALEMQSIGELTKNHFPELDCLHPTLNLKEYIRTNGMILCSRSLDHYNHYVIQTTYDRNITILSSTFNQAQCQLMEFNLSDSITVDLIQQSVIDYTLNCPVSHFVSCDALFHDKITRKLYLQSSAANLNLVEYIKTNPSHKIKQSLLLQLLCGIEKMHSSHSSKYCHGDVNPSNVFVEPNEEAGAKLRIGLPRFHETFEERVSRTAKYFSADDYPSLPEEEVTELFDVKCFACIAFWVFYPDQKFTANFQSDLQQLTKEEDGTLLKDLVESFLISPSSSLDVICRQHVFFEIEVSNDEVEDEMKPKLDEPPEEMNEEKPKVEAQNELKEDKNVEAEKQNDEFCTIESEDNLILND